MPSSVDTNVLVLPSGAALSTGLDIVAGTNASPLDTSRIRWLRQSDGAVVASMFGFDDPSSGGNLLISARATSIGVPGIVQVVAYNDAAAGPQASGLLVEQRARNDANAAHTRATVFLEGNEHTILDQSGVSEWLRILANPPVNAQAQFGHLGPVNTDAGGWANFTFPLAFPNAVDFVIAMNDSSGAQFSSTTWNTAAVGKTGFRCFTSVAGQNIGVNYLAIGH